MVWMRPLQRRRGFKDWREATLPHQVRQSPMKVFPVLWAERVSFHHKPHGDPCVQVPFRAQSSPQIEVVAKVKNFVRRTII